MYCYKLLLISVTFVPRFLGLTGNTEMLKCLKPYVHLWPGIIWLSIGLVNNGNVQLGSVKEGEILHYLSF
jgi:hypothetical protein